MPVTMRDVAEKAGVSIRTVSRVVNNQSEISDATRARVSAAIKTLGYRPNKLARAMVTRRTQTIGLIIGDIANPYFNEFTRGAMDVAEAEGYNVFVSNSDGNPDKQMDILESMAMHGVDGILLFSWHAKGAELKAYAETKAPVVVINRKFEHPRISLILTKIEHGAKLAVEYLIDKGHTKIGMIAGEAPICMMQRAKGYLDTLAAHNIPSVEEWILRGPPTFDHGYAATQRLLTTSPEITALFCYNDMIAMGAIQACKALGLRVPDDCAIVGFDNIQFAAMIDPPLTTIHMDKYELGEQATHRILRMLDNPDEILPPVYIDVELIIRKSA